MRTRENNLIEQSSRNDLVVLKARQLRVELGRIAGDVDDLVILFRELERSCIEPRARRVHEDSLDIVCVQIHAGVLRARELV